MTTCLGKSCSFGLLCMTYVNVYEFVCVLLSLLVLRVGCGNLIILILDHCFSVYLEGRMWYLIVLIPTHCPFYTFSTCFSSLLLALTLSSFFCLNKFLFI